MKSTNALIFGVLMLLLPAASAEGLLKPTCINTFTSDYATPMWVGDVNNDGVQDVVVGTRVNGIVSSYKYKGYDCNNDWGAVQSGGWTFTTDSGSDVLSIWVGDLKNDGKKNVVINGIEPILNKNARPVKKFVTAITQRGTEDWNIKELCGVSYTVYAADLDKTGVKNVIFGTKSSKVCVIKDDPITRSPLLWSYQTARPVWAVKADDVDGDGNVEVIALDRQSYASTVYCISSTGTLKWKYDVEGGVQISSTADRILQVADIDGDGKKEVLVGTYAHGVDVIDSAGSLKWNYKTQSSSTDLVSVILPYDINGDGKLEILVGAKPFLYAIDSSGSLKWKTPAETMIYGIAVGNIYGDSDNEIVTSSTRYVDVYSNTGSKIDRWAYQLEIQGKDVKFSEKDVNGLSVGIADLDGDGANEVVAAFGWQEDRDIVTSYYGDLRVFEVKKDFSPPETGGMTATTLSSGGTGIAPQGGEGEEGFEPPSTTLPSKGGSKIPCVPALPAVIALAITLLAGIPLAR